MLLTDITEEIKLLPRWEKIKLIETISKMLLDEENPAHYIDLEITYPIFTPSHQEQAAGQLQQFLSQNL